MNEFKFNPDDLRRPRKFGISAYMRIKNEAQFVRLAVESHLPFYDEIVCVYNDCSDATPEILAELQRRHPDKIRVFHYAPPVHPVGTPAHTATVGDDANINSVANYYNWTLAKCAYSIACKLDADHLAIPHKLEPAIAKIKTEFAAGRDKLFLFSGLNIAKDATGKLGIVRDSEQFSGNGDICYHRIDARSFFENRRSVEHFNNAYRRGVPGEYVGVLYMHLKHLKAAHAAACPVMSLDEFKSARHMKTLTAKLKLTRRLRLALLRRFALLRGGKTPMRMQRLLSLPDDLAEVDLQRDATDKL